MTEKIQIIQEKFTIKILTTGRKSDILNLKTIDRWSKKWRVYK